MKIQEDLVWDKHTGELFCFVDLGDIETNYATLKDVQELESHVLVFLVNICYIISNFYFILESS